MANPRTAFLATCLFLLCALLPAVLVAEPAAAPHATPVREADAACARCHQKIFNAYLQTPMANASGLAGDRWIPGTFHHARSNTDYRFFVEDGAQWMSYSRPGDASLQGRHRLDYFLGSAHLGLTYLYATNGYWFETPAAYYANLKGYDMKPGYAEIAQMPPGLQMTTGCMRCHMSDVQKEDAGSANRFSTLPFLHGGITCEMCHGDTRRHLATSGKAPVVNPARLDADRRDSVCISCHLEGATNVEHAGKHAVDYKPGERISDYLTYYQFPLDDATKRGVSEIEQFSQSKCKRSSGDRMSCMTCHDAHGGPTPETRAAFYRGKCLQCHNTGTFAKTHFPQQPDCTSCHMPKDGAENIPHVAWTDHRILRQQPKGSLQSLTPARGELVPILPGGTTQRDQALAYYNLLVSGESAQSGKALDALEAASKDAAADADIWMALGVLRQSKGNRPGAAEAYRQALQADPLNRTAATNLGTILAQGGDLSQAAALWKPVFSRNEDNVPLGMNLALAECMTGNRAAAMQTLERVLLYSPDDERARRKLDSIRSGPGECTAGSLTTGASH